MSSRRRRSFATIAVLALIAGGTLVGLARTGKIYVAGFSASTTTTIALPGARYFPAELRDVARAEAAVNASLPRRDGALAPLLGTPAFRTALAPHEVVGFFPSYELPRLGSIDLAGLTDVVYYGLQVEAGGSLLKSTSASLGWAALVNGAAGPLLKEAHADGDRVLLSAFSINQAVIHSLSGAGAASAGRKLADELAPILSSNGFDGVDLDLEGRATGDRPGFVRFVAGFSAALRAKGPSWTIMLNTYPQSAIDPTSFFDVKSLAPYVSRLFVMAYDMQDPQVPSPNAPLEGYNLDDVSCLATYAGAGLGSKVILGVPFYGYDFPASKGRPPAVTVGTPYTVTYAEIVQSIEHNGHKPLWDPQSETPYTAFLRAGQWHQTWFDDPVSVALKTALAAQFKVAGVGAWELGMTGASPAMLAVLAGGARVVKEPLATRS